MKPWGIVLILTAFTLSAQSQSFVAKGKLDTIKQDGFYKVLLTPANAAYINNTFSNIRIVDSLNAEVPYLLMEEKPVYLQHQFKEYTILDRKQITGSQTVIKLHNPAQAPIDNISLLIRNAEVKKQARLSGSDDGKTWFAVKEKFWLAPINNTASVNELRGIEFPLTNYTYYLLEVSDSSSAPINILKAGYYDVSKSHGVFSQITDSVSITTTTKDKKTFVYIAFRHPQFIDKLELNFSGSPYFQRHGSLTESKTRRIKKKEEQYDQWITDFTVRSAQTTVINFNGLRTDNLTLSIENSDNPPLQPGRLTAWQLNRYLIAWLKKDNTYAVQFGKDNQIAPDYDLGYFRDSIPANTPTVNIYNIQPATQKAAVPDTIFTSKSIIWIAIGVVIVLLGFMSIKLVRETNNASPRE